MSEDPIREYSDAEKPMREYSDAIEQFNLARSRVQKLGRLIGDVAHALNTKPLKLTVSNVSIGLPGIAMQPGVPSLNINDWPSAKQITEALTSLHELRRRVNESWRHLSDTDKGLLSPPDSM